MRIFYFMSPPRSQKRTLIKKLRSSVRYLKETIVLSNCKGLRLYYRAFLITIRLAVFNNTVFNNTVFNNTVFNNTVFNNTVEF